MELVYQVHNIGIFTDIEDSQRKERIHDLLKEQFDGFEIFKGQKIDYQLIIKDYQSLKLKTGIIVPQNSEFTEDEIFISYQLEIAFKIERLKTYFWVKDTTWYAPYLIGDMMLQQNKTFVHGAAISTNNKGILLLAFGGIGKTCFIANAVKRNDVQLLGDDLIIISENGKLYPYPRPFCLYKYHVKLFPQFFSGKTYKFNEYAKNKYWLRAKKTLKSKLNIKDKTIYSFLPVAPVHLFSKGKVENKPVDLEAVYILRRIGNIKEVNVKKINDIKYAVDFAQDVILHEWDVGLKIILNWYAQRFLSISDYINKQYMVINNGMRKVNNIFIVDIPENLDAEQVSIELNRVILE